MIRLIKPDIRYSDINEDFEKIFKSGWFSKGEYNEIFKEKIKSYVGSKFSFLTTSATTALSIALKTVGVEAGDEVIVSDFSFPATANVVEDLGARPVFADVSLRTYNMLPEEVGRKINKKTKAVIYVDTFGNPSGLYEIKNICKERNIPLIEDSACAIGSKMGEVMCGNIADITCFSFHPRKLINTGEGGAITTNNEAYAEFLKIKLNHGAIKSNDRLDFIEYGYNYRMSEIQAVMGVRQLESIDKTLRERIRIKESYMKFLVDTDYIAQTIQPDYTSNLQSLVFRVPDYVDRDGLINVLASKGIETAIGTYCLSGLTYYRKKYQDVQPNAAYLQDRTITLPAYSDLSDNDIMRISNSILMTSNLNIC